eukprot:jgi/Mesen1/2055/ME000150S01142
MAAQTCAIEAGCSIWKYRFFGDCVCSTHDAISFYLGMTSILCWAIAEVPQTIVNWRVGNSEGVSLAFILTWTVGDIFNLVGCLVDPVTHVWYNRNKAASAEEEEARVAASYFLQDDDEKPYIPAQARDPLEGLFPSDPTLADGTLIPGSIHSRGSSLGRPPTSSVSSSVPVHLRQSPGSYTGSWRRLTLSTSYGTSPRLRAVMFGVLLTGTLRFGTPLFGGASNDLSSPAGATAADGSGLATVDSGRKLLQVGEYHRPWASGEANATGPSSMTHYGGGGKVLRLRDGADAGGGGIDDDSGEIDLQGVIGQILGWAMTCIYLTGRIPQIFLNITRGSVEGLSLPMFAFAIGGNATYFGSILVRSTEWARVKPNLPWLVDSACCLLMDFFLRVLSTSFWLGHAQ